MEQPHHKNLWLRSFLFSFVSLYFFGLYLFIELGELSLRLINRATAWNAVLLVGLSLALSGICYFWNKFDWAIIYRKYLGIMGFLYACVHTILTIIQLTGKVDLFTYFFLPQNIIPFFFAVIALILLTFLTAISHNKAVNFFGGVNWRLLMRLAYLAFMALTAHFYFKTYEVIWLWIKNREFLPPLAAAMFIFACLVVSLRLLVAIDSQSKKQEKKPQTPQSGINV